MLLLGGSLGSFNFTRLYFTLIVLSLSTENVPFLLPDAISVGFMVFIVQATVASTPEDD